MATLNDPTNDNPAARVQRSMELYRRAEQIIPGATQLISRRPSRFACGVSPVYAARAKGSRIWDVDGNEYIDWVSGIGAIILGYADPVVNDAVTRQIVDGTIYSINHELELELAELLIETIPCAEMVRYAKGGGEACAIAVRIARGTTGRDRILFCGYHGWHDWYLAANLSNTGERVASAASHPSGDAAGVASAASHPSRDAARVVSAASHPSGDAALDTHLFPGIEPIGVPHALQGTAIPFPYGDLDALGQRLDDHRGEVAAIIMEPLRSEEPPEGYLAGVRKLATEHDVVLIFDEVSTGFRPSAAGVQPVVGVIPDMAVFAKSISNGFPMGVVVGKRDVMEPAARMFISSTYWSDTIGLRAALTTLRQVRTRDVPTRVRRIGATLKSRLNNLATECGVPVTCEGVDYHPHLHFHVEDTSLKTKLATLYIQEMAKRGCHGYPSFYLNAAQTDADLEQTINAARESFGLMADGIHDGTIDSLLECELREEAFRRLVS